MIANDFATNKINACDNELSEMLKDTDFKIVEFAFYDCAPCEVQYGLFLPGEVDLFQSTYSNGMPARKFLRNLRRVKRGSLTLEQFHDMCLAITERNKHKQMRKNTL